jgi:hypothetical protein
LFRVAKRNIVFPQVFPKYFDPTECQQVSIVLEDVLDVDVGRGQHVVDDGIGIKKCVFDEKRLFSNGDCTRVDEGVLQ